MKMLNCSECGLTITDAQEECPKCRTKVKEIKEELKRKTADIEEKKELHSESAKRRNDEAIKDIKPKSEKDELIETKTQVEEKDESKIKEIAEDTTDIKMTITTEDESLAAAVVEAEALAAIEEEKTAKVAINEEDEEKNTSKIKIEATEKENICTTCMTQINGGQNSCKCNSLKKEIEKTALSMLPNTDKEPLPNSDKESLPSTDKESKKFIAAIGYIIFFFPILSGYYRKSVFAKFHAKQATLLFISSTVLFFGLLVARDLLDNLIIYSPAAGATDPTQIFFIPLTRHHGLRTGGLFYWYLRVMLYALHLVPFAFMIIGMVTAMQGKKRRLPIIGSLAAKRDDDPI